MIFFFVAFFSSFCQGRGEMTLPAQRLPKNTCKKLGKLGRRTKTCTITGCTKVARPKLTGGGRHKMLPGVPTVTGPDQESRISKTATGYIFPQFAASAAAVCVAVQSEAGATV